MTRAADTAPGAVELKRARLKCVEKGVGGWIARCPRGHEYPSAGERSDTRSHARRRAQEAMRLCAACGDNPKWPQPIAGEQWLPLAGFEDGYEVSDHGRVKSLPRRKASGGLLTQYNRAGYRSVTLCVGGKSTVQLVHRLVLLTFVGPCPDGMECAHRDGDPTNNRLTNLYWATPKQNAADKDRHGNFRQAMASLRRISPAESAFIRANRNSTSQASLAAMFGVCADTIRRHSRTTLNRSKGS